MRASSPMRLAAAVLFLSKAASAGQNEAPLTSFTLLNGRTVQAFTGPDTFVGQTQKQDSDEGKMRKLKRRRPKKEQSFMMHNLTPEPQVASWEDPDDPDSSMEVLAEVPPFSSVAISMSTSPPHGKRCGRFCFNKDSQPECWKKFNVHKGSDADHRQDGGCHMDLFANCFDPFPQYSEINDLGMKYGSVTELNPDQLPKYYALKDQIDNANRYRHLTGREFLRFDLEIRPPSAMMRQAETFGEKLVVPTRATQFVTEEGRLAENRQEGESNQIQSFFESRTPDSTTNITLQAVAPRIFEIPNFLSDSEVDYILNLTTTSSMKFVESTSSRVISNIYQRLFDTVGVKRKQIVDLEAKADDYHGLVVEPLKIVEHHAETEENGGFLPRVLDTDNFSSFAKLRVFLNDNVDGGEVVFHDHFDAEGNEGLMISPEKGKAVLVYTMLPDGNHDYRSQFTTAPVLAGSSWVAEVKVLDL